MQAAHASILAPRKARDRQRRVNDARQGFGSPAGAESAQRLEKCQQIVQGSRIVSCDEFHPCAWSHCVRDPEVDMPAAMVRLPGSTPAVVQSLGCARYVLRTWTKKSVEPYMSMR